MQKTKTQIHTLSINKPIPEATLTKWLNYLPPERQNQLQKFRFRDDYLRSLYGETILRTIIAEKVEISPKTITISRPEGKKPFLPNYPDIHFSISHSGEWVVCAVSDTEIGIDIEKIGEKEVKSSLKSRVLTKNELGYLETLSNKQKTTIFYQYWTIKEAYSKCIGLGLGIDFRKIEIAITGQEITLTDNGKKWDGMIRSLDFSKDYALALCTEKPINTISFLDFA